MSSFKPAYRQFFYLIALLMLVPCAWPQAGTGSVSGTVRDQTAAVVPGAPVSLQNTATGETSRLVTNEAGSFTFPSLIPGPCRLSVEVAGMEKWQGDLTVQVSARAVIDPTLKVGQAGAASVTVTDVTPLVNVADAART